MHFVRSTRYLLFNIYQRRDLEGIRNMAKCRIVTERSYTTPRIKFGSVIALDQPEFTFLRALPEYRLNRLLPTKIKSFADHVEVEIYHGSFVINNEFRYLQFNIATTRVVCRSCLLKRVQRANFESGSRHSHFIRRWKTSAIQHICAFILSIHSASTLAGLQRSIHLFV